MDEIDLKLLRALSENARQSKTQLAKKLRISKSTLLYRITNLQRNVIREYVTIVDHASSNHMYVRVSAKGMLPRVSFMSYYAKVHGMYDIVFAFYAKTLIEAQQVIDIIRPNVESMHISFALHFYTCFPKSYGLNSPPVRSSFLQLGTTETANQQSVLNQLEQNPQATILAIASALSLAPKTIVQHKRQLEKKRIILKYSISINSKIFGFEQAHINWSENVNNADAFRNYLLANAKTVYVTQVFGGKLESEYLFESHKELHYFFTEMKKMFSVIAESYFVYD